MKNKTEGLSVVPDGAERRVIEDRVRQSRDGDDMHWVLDVMRELERHSERNGHVDVFKELKIARLRIALCLNSEND